MSTRAVYTFRDGQEEFHVYKHFDGYPSGAVEFIEEAKKHAWTLPRFEADEFAAAFVSANKSINSPGNSCVVSGGNIRLMRSGNWRDVSPADIEFRYEITHMPEDKDVTVFAYSVSCPYDERNPSVTKFSESLIFHGTLGKMKTWTQKMEKKG